MYKNGESSKRRRPTPQATITLLRGTIRSRPTHHPCVRVSTILALGSSRNRRGGWTFLFHRVLEYAYATSGAKITYRPAHLVHWRGFVVLGHGYRLRRPMRFGVAILFPHQLRHRGAGAISRFALSPCGSWCVVLLVAYRSHLWAQWATTRPGVYRPSISGIGERLGGLLRR